MYKKEVDKLDKIKVVDNKLVYIKGVPNVDSLRNTFLSKEYLSTFGKIIFINISEGTYVLNENHHKCLNAHVLF